MRTRCNVSSSAAACLQTADAGLPSSTCKLLAPSSPHGEPGWPESRAYTGRHRQGGSYLQVNVGRVNFGGNDSDARVRDQHVYAPRMGPLHCCCRILFGHMEEVRTSTSPHFWTLAMRFSILPVRRKLNGAHPSRDRVSDLHIQQRVRSTPIVAQ